MLGHHVDHEEINNLFTWPEIARRNESQVAGMDHVR